MRFHRIAFALVVFGLVANTPAWSILIEVKDAKGMKRKIGGFVDEKSNDKWLVLRVPPSKDTERFEMGKIKILYRVDPKQFEKLKKEKPASYFDAAELLAKEKEDPEAVDAAIRLWLIAAYLDTASYGKKSLLRMSELTTNPSDARKYRAAAHILDPNGDAALLKNVTPKPPGPAVKPPYPLTRFQKALEQYRNGGYAKAALDAKIVGVHEYFSKAGLDHDTFLQKCKDSQVSEDYLKDVMRAEVWALDQLLTEPAIRKTPGNWNSAMNSPQNPVPLLMLGTITPFDPRQCVFRDGKWSVP